jgi:hypothetical protein
MSSRPPLLLPTDGRNGVRAKLSSATAIQGTNPEDKKALVSNFALALVDLTCGVAQAESNHQFVSSKEQCVVFTHKRTCYMNNKRLPPTRVGARKMLADGAQAIVMEDIRAEDWHEQLVATVARVKDFFRILEI